MSNHPDPVFPEEIEEIIFSLYAESDLKQSKDVIFVAKRVYHWIRKLVYKISIHHHVEGVIDRPRLRNSLHLQVHGAYIRHLLIWRPASPHEDICINNPALCLSWCPNLTDIALWSPDTIYNQALLTQLSKLKDLRSLSLNVTLLHDAISGQASNSNTSSSSGSDATTMWIAMKITQFPNITHLDIVGITNLPTAKQMKSYFPSVTHLALIHRRGVTIKEIKEVWRGQLVVLIWYVDSVNDTLREEDGRVVLMPQTRDWVYEWNETAKDGKESVWRKAEDVVELRRLGGVPLVI